jgi:hypothetical protein
MAGRTSRPLGLILVVAKRLYQTPLPMFRLRYTDVSRGQPPACVAHPTAKQWRRGGRTR